jgi:hypothetical protein
MTGFELLLKQDHGKEIINPAGAKICGIFYCDKQS